MKKLKLYQVDAFASNIFKGNPAAVCILDEPLTEKEMQAIACENNLSETAFVLPVQDNFNLRWFTPNTEVDLCGHATLASAYVLFEKLAYPKPEICFQSKSGELFVTRQHQQLQMDFPALPYQAMTATEELLDALTVKPQEIYESTFDLLCVFQNETEIKTAIPNLGSLSQLTYRGIIFTALGDDGTTIYSRCFYPACNVPEDPVTGSAHCVIAPFWCDRLNQSKIQAVQGLARQGELSCEIKNGRVLLTGRCHLYFEGIIYIPDEL
ncbi:epimerase [Legionella nautarum]|uniref:Epimerase n=1 Tax=Legionella nautarum TaxID=45070 RepID=A0A0W0WLM4_9GAMM|nr:PhzF family phenazine biosynthesis protein [Legionella nautarum]KTD33224.1 epimerase [Legionella nautarum]